MSLFRWRGTVLRQFWSSFAIVLVLNQFVVLGSMYLFLFKPAVASFSALAAALVDAGYRQQYAPSEPGLGVLSERWISDEHILIVPGEIRSLPQLPPYPGLRLIGKNVEQRFGGQVRLGFTVEPEQTLWLQYDGERPFAVGIPMAERLQGLRLLLVAVVMTLLLSSLAAWIIAEHLTRPLAHLSSMARRLGQGDDVGAITVSDESPTEIAQLATALDQMRCEINQMLHERERFLTGIAHDLRTPLSRMRVALELQDMRESEINEGLRDDIEEMRAILDQFIELSRLDMEQSEPTQRGDLNAVVKTVAEKYRRSGETLVFHAETIPVLRFKPLALKRLLYNLIDNALRYGQGDVVIETRLTVAGQVCLLIKNRQSESARESALVAALRWVSHDQQSGLGMAIVRRLAEVHEAELQIVSESNGERQVQILFNPGL